MATAAVHAGLEVVVAVVFQTSAAAAAVYNEAEHAGELQKAVPFLLLPVMQLVCPLL